MQLFKSTDELKDTWTHLVQLKLLPLLLAKVDHFSKAETRDESTSGQNPFLISEWYDPKDVWCIVAPETPKGVHKLLNRLRRTQQGWTNCFERDIQTRLLLASSVDKTEWPGTNEIQDDVTLIDPIANSVWAF